MTVSAGVRTAADAASGANNGNGQSTNKNKKHNNENANENANDDADFEHDASDAAEQKRANDVTTSARDTTETESNADGYDSHNIYPVEVSIGAPETASLDLAAP